MSELQEFAEGIWTIDGPSARMLGVPLPTRMIVVKLSDGSLWVNSPVSVPIQALECVKALGSVRYLVAPTNCISGGWKSGTRYSLKRNFGYFSKIKTRQSHRHSPASCEA
jgi:hypothetical protein